MHQTRSIRLGLLVTLALALVTTVAVAQNEDAVRDATVQWQERYNAGDATGIADLYTEDLRWIVLSGTTHTDHEGVLAQVNGLFEAGYDTIQIVVDDVERAT